MDVPYLSICLFDKILSCDSDSTRQRWMEAMSSHLTSDNPGEKLYEEWDCPQVSAIHAYTAIQPDELSLQAGDVVKVLKKTSDGKIEIITFFCINIEFWLM